MDWRGRRGSNNIEDRRASAAPGRRGAQVGGLGVVAVLLIGYFLGIDVTPLLDGTDGQQGGPVVLTEADQDAAEFVRVTLADTEEVWAAVFREQVGRAYRPATLVLFKDVTDSPCGDASGATGPFYCPIDRKVYLDTAFFTTLQNRLGAGGDFAAAYVVAHEIGHHVQHELGILQDAQAMRAQGSEAESNAISVQTELQADCLAGVWSQRAAAQFGSLQDGDLEEAVNAARQIGDDTLQRNAGARPMPHTFTHGTSAQRARWFAIGARTGDITACDTFTAPDL